MAAFFGAEPREIVFTGGATEANNLAIVGYALRNRRKGDHVVISEAEHISCSTSPSTSRSRASA